MTLSLWRDLNLRATWKLGRRMGGLRTALCRGKVQLSLAPGARFPRPREPSQIGIPLMGGATNLSATTVLSAAEGAELTIDGAVIGRGAIVSAGQGARVSIGPGSLINDGSRLAASKEISIGRECQISWCVTIIDDDGHGFGPPPYSAPVFIEDHVWIGCNVTILKGVRIGAGSVVAAGAVVTHSCPPGSLIAGVPAKVIRSGVSWRNP